MSQRQQPLSVFKKHMGRRLVAALACIGVIYLLAPRLSYFHDSLAAIGRADKVYFGWALIFIALSYIIAAVAYCLLAYFKLPYMRTLLIQLADGFTNRLLPAGLGGMATNALYLIKQKNGDVRAGYLAGLNNLLGIFGHTLLLVILLIISHSADSKILRARLSAGWLIATLVITITLIILLLTKGRLKHITKKGIAQIKYVWIQTVKKPFSLLGAFLASLFVTVCYGLALYAICLALNIHETFLTIFLILTLSLLAKSITPTPGGIGGMEAGLVAGLVTAGVAPGPALSVALVYNFIIYWLPILPGFICFEIALKRRYFNYL